MRDPRKPVERPTDPFEGERLREAVRDVLRDATEAGAKRIGTTGASFVIMGIGVWVSELAEVDAKEASKMLRGIADLFDPKLSENRKMIGEKRRREAVEELLAKIDLAMSDPEGKV